MFEWNVDEIETLRSICMWTSHIHVYYLPWIFYVKHRPAKLNSSEQLTIIKAMLFKA